MDRVAPRWVDSARRASGATTFTTLPAAVGPAVKGPSRQPGIRAVGRVLINMAKLSDLATMMLHRYGYGRLKLMQAEYEAGFPLDMNATERQNRIGAITEILTRTGGPARDEPVKPPKKRK